MNRMDSLKYVTKTINLSAMSENEKAAYLKTYKANYYAWLDDLKQKLDNYQPPFEDTEARESISPSFNYSENDLKGEGWKDFPNDTRYTVSNLGRIKFEGKIQRQIHKIDPKTGKTQWGYLVLEDKNLSDEYVYNFVALTFLGKIKGDGYHVHHITNDGYYNTEDNLILLTKDEHSYVHGFEIGR